MPFDLHRHLKEHGANMEAIRTLRAELTTARANITRLQAALEQARGGWRIALLVGGVAGTLASIITRVFFH